MNIILVLYVFALFVVIQPNVLIQTKNPHILVHGLIFTIILYFTYDLVKDVVEGNESYSVTIQEPGKVMQILDKFMNGNALNVGDEQEQEQEEKEKEDVGEQKVDIPLSSEKKIPNTEFSSYREESSNKKKKDEPVQPTKPMQKVPERSESKEVFDYYSFRNKTFVPETSTLSSTSKVPEKNKLDCLEESRLVNKNQTGEWMCYSKANEKWEMGNTGRVYWTLEEKEGSHPPDATWKAETTITSKSTQGNVVYKK